MCWRHFSFFSISVITHKQQFPLMPLISCSVWIALETFNWPSQVTDLSAMNIPVIVIVNSHLERNNLYYFSWANQQKAGTKIYSLTQCSLSVNECNWNILAGNDQRINSHCLTRKLFTDQSELCVPPSRCNCSDSGPKNWKPQPWTIY